MTVNPQFGMTVKNKDVVNEVKTSKMELAVKNKFKIVSFKDIVKAEVIAPLKHAVINQNKKNRNGKLGITRKIIMLI